MPTICCDTPLPTLESLLPKVSANLTFPPTGFSLPSLPGLRSPLFPSLSMINLELIKVVQALQDFQIMGTIKLIMQPLLSVLGGAIDVIFPKVPGTDISFSDLLAGDPSVLFPKIKIALDINGPSIFPFLPNPIFGSLSIPDIEISEVMGFVIKGYLNSLISIITGTINSVIGILNIPGLPGLPPIPTLPSLPTILASISASFPSLPNLQSIISSIPIPTIFSNLSIPEFPSLALPTPLVPSFSMPDIEFSVGLGGLLSNFLTIPLNIIVGYLTSTLSMLGFSFPTVCVPI